MASESDDRHFVTIRSDSPEQLAQVRELGLDLFGATAKPEKEGVTIEGLLSKDDVKRVEAEGAKVDVHEHVSARSRADEQTSDLAEWLKDIGA
jgi:hypothetical protein